MSKKIISDYLIFVLFIWSSWIKLQVLDLISYEADYPEAIYQDHRGN